MSDVDKELDRLFGLPLDEFTAARNELARRLKAENQGDEAQAVRALGKPTIAAWAINQLSRRQGAGIRRLLDAGETLRRAQEKLLRQGGSSEPVRSALADVREQVHTLRQSAQAIIEEAGRSATPATLDRIDRTLQAAALDEDGRRELAAGRLTSELEPPGFEAFAGLKVAPERNRAPVRDELAERRRLREEQQRRRREAQQRVRELEHAAREAEQEAKRAEKAAADARRAAEKARAAADEASAELTELE